jgi:hypothetical protein
VVHPVSTIAKDEGVFTSAMKQGVTSVLCCPLAFTNTFGLLRAAQ